MEECKRIIIWGNDENIVNYNITIVNSSVVLNSIDEYEEEDKYRKTKACFIFVPYIHTLCIWNGTLILKTWNLIKIQSK